MVQRLQPSVSNDNRLDQLSWQKLEETAVALIDLLAKLDRPYLTALEEKLLTVLEADWGILLRSCTLSNKNQNLVHLTRVLSSLID